jgi:NTP pyrophosphatase (non-canonical NTP hydrolase)
MNLNELARQLGVWRRSKGFHTPESIEDGESLLGKLMLVVTEVAEAAEAVRSADMENFEEEMADVLIRTLDITDAMGIDIEQAITNKMEINERRPALHGRKVAI